MDSIERTILYLSKIILVYKTISILFPSGAPISQHRLRCSPFDVDYCYLMGCCLAAAAISAPRNNPGTVQYRSISARSTTPLI